MERIVLRHLSGSKANQVEEFPLAHVKELTLGRDPSSTVKYDPERDDLVGRQHARIAQDPSDASQFVVTDLNSRNGTFVNKQRLNGTTRLNPGDLIQLGPGGPEFQFDVEPRPAGSVRATRVPISTNAPTLTGGGPGVPPTRGVGVGPAAQPNGPGHMPPTSSASTVGRATVERIVSHNITETKKREGRKFALVGGAVAVALLILFTAVVGYLVWRSRSREQQLAENINAVAGDVRTEREARPMSPAQIAENYGKAVVYIETSWRLINTQNQAQVYHQLLDNSKGQIVSGGPGVLAAYIDIGGDKYEPWLSYEKTNRLSHPRFGNVPIGGNHAGTGFVVSSNGIILTNRHVAATWKTAYTFDPNTPPGIIFTAQGPRMDAMGRPAIVKPPTNWVPVNTKQEGRQIRGSFNGVNDVLDVTFPNKENRISARLVQSSDRHDVATIKIESFEPLSKVELNDNYDSIKIGESVVVLGYPQAAPRRVGVVESKDVFNREAQWKLIPNPTLTPAAIGAIHREQEAGGGKDHIVSEIGDAYQLSTSATGSGNSGGPVFDDRGRVIAIFFASNNPRVSDVVMTYAVPIRFARQLMSN